MWVHVDSSGAAGVYMWVDELTCCLQTVNHYGSSVIIHSDSYTVYQQLRLCVCADDSPGAGVHVGKGA